MAYNGFLELMLHRHGALFMAPQPSLPPSLYTGLVPSSPLPSAQRPALRFPPASQMRSSLDKRKQNVLCGIYIISTYDPLPAIQSFMPGRGVPILLPPSPKKNKTFHQRRLREQQSGSPQQNKKKTREKRSPSRQMHRASPRTLMI